MYRRRGKRRGVILVAVAGSLIVLLVFVGMAVDIPSVVAAAQRAQSVADAAALAGAVSGPDDWVVDVATWEVQQANSPTGAKSPVYIVENGVAITEEGGTAVGYGVMPEGFFGVSVTTECYAKFAFLDAIGVRGMTVTRTALAVADLHPFLPCIFAEENAEAQKNSDWGVDYSGSGSYIDGMIHSNGKVDFTGQGHTITGDIEYRGEISIALTGNDIRGRIIEDDIEAYPVWYTWNEFVSKATTFLGPISIQGGAATVPGSGVVYVNGNMTIGGNDKTFPSNVTYVVNGDVKISGTNHSFDHISIVASGSIEFDSSSSLTPIEPNEEDLLLMSTKVSLSDAASQTAITFNGSGHHNAGIIFAPDGNIVFNGGSSVVYDGALMGKNVGINGSGFRINRMRSYNQKREVRLVK
jgi:hypothetical protein